MEGNVLEISPCSQLTQLRSRPQPPGRSPLRGGEDPPHPAVGLRSSGGMAGDDRRSPPGHGRPLPGLGGAAAARDGLREAAVRGPAARGACRASRCEALRRAGPPGESLICLPVLGMSKPLLFMIKKKTTKQTPYTLAQVFCPCPSPWWVGGEPRAAACSAAWGTTHHTSTLVQSPTAPSSPCVGLCHCLFAGAQQVENTHQSSTEQNRSGAGRHYPTHPDSYPISLSLGFCALVQVSTPLSQDCSSLEKTPKIKLNFAIQMASSLEPGLQWAFISVIGHHLTALCFQAQGHMGVLLLPQRGLGRHTIVEPVRSLRL